MRQHNIHGHIHGYPSMDIHIHGKPADSGAYKRQNIQRLTTRPNAVLSQLCRQ